MAQQIQFIYLSQSEYDNLTPKNPGRIYFTSDTHRIYKGSDLYAATTFDQLTFNEIDASSITVNGSAVSLEGHTHSIADISDFGNYASVSHSHVSADISDFGQAVVSAGTSVFASASHTHIVSDITGLSTVLSGITNTTVSKSSGSFNTLTVGGSNVSVEGHTHSINDIEDFDEQGIFEVTGTIDLSSFPSVSVSTDQTLEDALIAANAERPVRCTLQCTGTTVKVISFAEVTYSSNGEIVNLEFGQNLDSNWFSSDHSSHPYMLRLRWFYSDGDEVWTCRPSELATTDHTHDISDIDDLETTLSGFASSSHTHVMSEVTGLQSAIDGLSSIYAGTSHSHAISDITNLSTILTGVSESSLTKDTITGDIGNFRLLSVSGSANFAVNNVSANAISVNGTPVSLEGHTHGVSEVTGLADVISAATSGFASSQHSHSHADVTDFDSAVVTAGSSSFAPISHSHAISSITGLTASLSELSSSIQSLQSQITPVQCITLSQYEALQTVDASTIYFISDGNRIYRGSVLYAATTFDELTFSSIEASGITVNGSAVALEGHTHGISEITGLSNVLSGISETGIAKNTVTASVGTFSSSLTVGGSNVALSGHTHGVSEITGLSSYATQSWVTQQINAAISAVLASQY